MRGESNPGRARPWVARNSAEAELESVYSLYPLRFTLSSAFFPDFYLSATGERGGERGAEK